MIGRIGPLIRAHRHDGHPVLRVHRRGPRDGKAAARRRGFRRGDRGFRQFGFRHRFRRRFRLGYGRADPLHGGGKFGGVPSGQEHPAGAFGDTGEFLVFMVGQIETDDMGGEGDPLFGHLRRDRTGIVAAILAPVRDQNHGRGPVAPGQFLGRVLDGRRKRRAPQRIDPGDDIEKRPAIHRTDRHHGFDIRAGTLLPVAIGDKAQIGPGGPGVEQVAHHPARDLDLCHTVDLAPHRPRGVIDDHHVFGLQSRGGKKRDTEGRCRTAHSHCHSAHFWSPFAGPVVACVCGALPPHRHPVTGSLLPPGRMKAAFCPRRMRVPSACGTCPTSVQAALPIRGWGSGPRWS